MLKNLTIRQKLLYAFISIASMVVLSSAFSIYFLNNLKQKEEEIAIELSPLIDAIMELKLNATNAHLTFEEIMSGDDSEDIKQVWDLLDETIWYCDAILVGGKKGDNTYYKTDNAEIKLAINQVKTEVEEFIKNSHVRYDNLKSSGGSLDTIFNKQYLEIQNLLTKIINNNRANNSIVYNLSGSKYLLANGHLYLEQYLLNTNSIDIDEVIENFEEAQDNILEYSKTNNNEDVQELNKTFKKLIKTLKKRNENALKSTKAGSQIEQKYDELFEKFIKESNKAEEIIVEHIAENVHEVRTNNIFAITIMILISILAIGISVVLTIFFSKSILDSIKRASDYIKQVSKGDLTLEMNSDSTDEIGVMLNDFSKMVLDIHDIMININSGSRNISDATKGISSTSQEIAQGSNEQASSIEEISSSAEQLSANTQQNTDNAQETEKIAIHASAEITKGSNAVKETSLAMQTISEKISIISEIAFQTNILALNAAVEAARAGEHGKGFAVVAAEVRSLAVRSLLAAKEINEITTKSVDIALRTNELFTDIVPLIQRTSSLVQEIAAASSEQSNGITQISSAIQTLNIVTQQNAASSEELASSSEEIASQSEALVDAISYFKVKKQMDVYSNSNKKTKRHEAQLRNEIVNKSNTGIDLHFTERNDDDFTVF